MEGVALRLRRNHTGSIGNLAKRRKITLNFCHPSALWLMYSQVAESVGQRAVACRSWSRRGWRCGAGRSRGWWGTRCRGCSSRCDCVAAGTVGWMIDCACLAVRALIEHAEDLRTLVIDQRFRFIVFMDQATDWPLYDSTASKASSIINGTVLQRSHA